VGQKLLLLIALMGVLCFFGCEQFSKNAQPETAFYIKDLELPKTNFGGQVVHYKGFSLEYAEKYEQPYWVAYYLSAERLAAENTSRKDKFKEDPNIVTGSAELSDYKNSGYDRGHLAPSADMKWDAQAMDECFYMSNMSPQNKNFNQKIWKYLEEYVRDRAVTDKLLYIVTGPILEDGLPTIGDNVVAIPKYYYKALLDYTGEEVKAIAFIMPNQSSGKKIEPFALTIDELETRTAIDFFPGLPDSLEIELESTLDKNLWFGKSYGN